MAACCADDWALLEAGHMRRGVERAISYNAVKVQLFNNPLSDNASQ